MIRIRAGSDIHKPEATRTLADSSKLINRYKQLVHNPHHKEQHSWLPASVYGAFTSSQDDPGVKEDTGGEPGGKKHKLQHIIVN